MAESALRYERENRKRIMVSRPEREMSAKPLTWHVGADGLELLRKQAAELDDKGLSKEGVQETSELFASENIAIIESDAAKRIIKKEKVPIEWGEEAHGKEHWKWNYQLGSNNYSRKCLYL
ncbi:hypothetical protein COOONC_26542 [Cooperia oncophora]